MPSLANFRRPSNAKNLAATAATAGNGGVVLLQNGTGPNGAVALSGNGPPQLPPPPLPNVTPPAAWMSELADLPGKDDETLLTTLQELFCRISAQKKKTGVVAPNQFVSKLKKENELFRSTMQQDAHEFLNYTLNAIAEILLRHKKEIAERLQAGGTITETSSQETSEGDEKKLPEPASWVHGLFEGFLTNETKCLTCETVTNRDEAFLDLSVDIEQHSSVTSCLRNFSVSETLCQKDKFFCDQCCSLQEAEKRMKIKRLPSILALHLKRFKYQERLQRHVKLSYRVVFPMELRLFSTSDDAEDGDRLYALSSVIVHIGNGPTHGHYITLVKSATNWVLFDDENVEVVEESEIQRYFGDQNALGTAYILFYERSGFEGV
ncbi:hypothetical protein HK101_010832 [Irineochytrium annulatum]|nr:hypothetical protein HK101_010832 [Irineochytrium annulatum]